MTKSAKKSVVVPTAWKDLNKILMTSDEATTSELLAAERAGRRRKQFLLRIHSRLNKVRAANERAQLIEDAA